MWPERLSAVYLLIYLMKPKHPIVSDIASRTITTSSECEYMIANALFLHLELRGFNNCDYVYNMDKHCNKQKNNKCHVIYVKANQFL